MSKKYYLEFFEPEDKNPFVVELEDIDQETGEHMDLTPMTKSSKVLLLDEERNVLWAMQK